MDTNTALKSEYFLEQKDLTSFEATLAPAEYLYGELLIGKLMMQKSQVRLCRLPVVRSIKVNCNYRLDGG